MNPVLGKVPGFSYSIGGTEGAICVLCQQSDVPVMRASGRQGICEPCSRLADWIWQDTRGNALPPPAFPTTPNAAVVIIVQERPQVNNIEDMSQPMKFLMVGRKDDTGKFGFPGGKLEKDETPEEAAVRELRGETGIETWPSALEPLYCGYTPRGRMIKTYLCRGYHGEPVSVDGLPVDWLAEPVPPKTGVMEGFHAGLMEAFALREKWKRKMQIKTPSSLELGKSAVDYLELKLSQLTPRGVKPGDARVLEGYSYVITGEEREVMEIILGTHVKIRDARAVAAMPKSPIPAPAAPKPAEVAGDDDVEEDVEDEEEEPGEDGMLRRSFVSSPKDDDGPEDEDSRS